MSDREQLREEIARTLWEADNPAYGLAFQDDEISELWRRSAGTRARQGYDRRADAVLALPAVAALLDAADKVRRVEELAEELESHRGGHDADVAADIRRALRGTS